MIIAAAKMSFKRLSMFTLLSLCVNGIVARKLSACIYGSARQPFLCARRPILRASATAARLKPRRLSRSAARWQSAPGSGSRLRPRLNFLESQSDLFGAEATPAYRPNPDKVRARLHKILAEARAGQTSPWEPARVSLYRTIFPQMTLWLPEDEAAQLPLPGARRGRQPWCRTARFAATPSRSRSGPKEAIAGYRWDARLGRNS
jgi:hypothetical protein